jgi:hypothetical protein
VVPAGAPYTEAGGGREGRPQVQTEPRAGGERLARRANFPQSQTLAAGAGKSRPTGKRFGQAQLFGPVARALVRLAPGDPHSDPWPDLRGYGEQQTERFRLGLYYTRKPIGTKIGSGETAELVISTNGDKLLRGLDIFVTALIITGGTKPLHEDVPAAGGA